jgi:hypothetical protein
VQPLGSAPAPLPTPRQSARLRPVDDTTHTLAVSGRSCSCGHGKQAHEHYRRGTDCALCTCARYRRPRFRLFGR